MYNVIDDIISAIINADWASVLLSYRYCTIQQFIR